ncbi:hypothetical protein EDD16DRAFT_785338 [Pisolithus croceorrhizus]|nr:hypothetical protein EDD16DRAFT_785338 [Pisolithus croceorrhizus]KAI6168041.1 hypothetical protein EDD17DRAFT_742232 [Pisolithus thermaeus]
MSRILSTIMPNLFQNCIPLIAFETSSEDFLDAGYLRSFLSTVMSEGAIGISASYWANCQLGSIAFSSPSRAFAVRLFNGDLSLCDNRSKRSRIVQGRSLLEEQIVCNADCPLPSTALSLSYLTSHFAHILFQLLFSLPPPLSHPLVCAAGLMAIRSLVPTLPFTNTQKSVA